MEAFFSTFPGFKYNPRNKPELEFERLRAIRKWPIKGPAYRKKHKKFLKALVEETKSPVHTLFITQYPDFDYDSRAPPRAEFERLAVFRKWSADSPKYQRAKTPFEEAYKKEFHSDLDIFFEGFPEFDHNPRSEPKYEFERLKKLKGWSWKERRADRVVDEECKRVSARFFGAFVDVFNSFFGITGDLSTWRFLCDVLEVDPIPNTIDECKKALKPIHVNIYDVLGHVREKTPIKKFATVTDLANYSRGGELFFPIDEARGTTLEFLLRRIL